MENWPLAEKFTLVSGSFNRHQVKIYTISTCMWCKRLKRKLSENGIAYSYLDIDLISSEEKDRLRPYLRRYRNILSFPMMFVDEDFIPNEIIDEKIMELVNDT